MAEKIGEVDIAVSRKKISVSAAAEHQIRIKLSTQLCMGFYQNTR